MLSDSTAAGDNHRKDFRTKHLGGQRRCSGLTAQQEKQRPCQTVAEERASGTDSRNE
jgi:hypothetical protein